MDYYYGKEAGQYAFYRIPKLLIANKRFENMKCEAKLGFAEKDHIYSN